ncbi:hypothetical protein Pla144_25960 [Bythopirellula polymerisocia]|uniref:Uncharacterized protein n=2 Tax=Bythopirellula polymerisocia TaxID=2528003 RepID=A0A5C6CYV4_9BACT|nr:hypothetical protein Pla144_25960 [Bythopirellula polymerisocia]
MFWLLLFAAGLCGTTLADDRSGDFLDKLREKGWHDVALEYLEQASDDPLATPEFLGRVEFEMAVTRSDLARRTVNANQRQAMLSEAAEGLRNFAAKNPNSPYSLTALGKLGNLLADQGLSVLKKAEQLSPQGASDQLREQARTMLVEAATTLEQVDRSIAEQLGTLSQVQPGQSNKEVLKQRQELEDKQAEVRFLLANLNYEKARTYAPDSAERHEVLEDAADGFARLQKEYENKLVGFYAQLYEGRCYQDMGNCKKALKIYESLVGHPVGHADFRKLLARAVRYRAECHLASNEPDKAIEECSEWLDRSRGEELEQPEWLAVTFRLANAYNHKIDSDEVSGNVSRMRTEVRKLLREVARQSGEFQNEARAALALSGENGSKPVEVKGFKDAFEAGKAAIEQMGSSQLAAKLAVKNNPDAVSDLQQQARENREAAIRYFESALKLGGSEVSKDQLVEARYFLSRLYWEQGRTSEAAALGLEIAQEHPDSPFASTAAQVTLAVYEGLFLEAQAANKKDALVEASQKLREIAELIVANWNDSPAAVTATNLLISIAMRENNLDEADQLLAKLPAESRSSASLSLGGSLWARYLQLAAESNPASDPTSKEFKSRAAKNLAEGYQSLSNDAKLNLAQAASVLYYVQYLLGEGDAKQALAVLENPTVGPLAQLDHPEFGGNSAFALETFKAALQVYLSVDPPQEKKAIAMMERLDRVTGSSPQAQKQLTSIYVNLGLQLQKEIKALTASGNQAKARSVAAAFAGLLRRVAERGDSQSWSVQTWLAETSMQLGGSLRGSDAERYLEQAEKAYRDLIAAAEKDPSTAPSELAVLAVRKKLGESLLAQGKFEPAIEQFTAVLTDKPNILELQQAAAEALQQWGATQSDPEKIEASIQGAQPQVNGKNLIWGWLKMAKFADLAKRNAALKTDPASVALAAKYYDLFFNARYHAAEARLAAANMANGTQRTEQKATVRQSIETLKQLYPDLGGPNWQQKFDSLLKESQK